MPPKQKKHVMPDGREVPATVVAFQEGGEHWNEYLLQDGTVLRTKQVMTEILRIEGEYDTDGNPVYFTKFANVASISAPDNLRKKAK